MLPPGVTVGQYIRFTGTALLTMFLGSQLVHTYYKPLNDLSKYVEAEIENLPADQKLKIKMELQLENIK